MSEITLRESHQNDKPGSEIFSSRNLGEGWDGKPWNGTPSAIARQWQLQDNEDDCNFWVGVAKSGDWKNLQVEPPLPVPDNAKDWTPGHWREWYEVGLAHGKLPVNYKAFVPLDTLTDEDFAEVAGGDDVLPAGITEEDFALASQLDEEVIPDKPDELRMGDDAYHGIAGECVRAIQDHTEADAAAVLINFLIMAGSALGREPTHYIGSVDHHANLFAVLVGDSGSGRKGVAIKEALRFFETVEGGEFLKHRQRSGLSSREGLIDAVRDERKVPKLKRGRNGAPDTIEQEVVPGVDDKRLLIVEPEFSSVLAQRKRQGNTLSESLRDFWDNGDQGTMVKNNPLEATGAHISLVGCITPQELASTMSGGEKSNGFANRFLWVYTARERLIPRPKRVDISELQERVASAIEAVRILFESEEGDRLRSEGVVLAEAAEALWRRLYGNGKRVGELNKVVAGVDSELTTRAAPIVKRLAMIYALLDGQVLIDTVHLRAARAVWCYCLSSLKIIFGQTANTGNKLADKILTALKTKGRKTESGGLTRTEIHEATGRNAKAVELAAALEVLKDKRLAYKFMYTESDDKRYEVWAAA